MIKITLDRAKALESVVDLAVRELNRAITTAAANGLIVEASIVDFEHLGNPGPTPLVNVTVKVRPDQIVKAAEDCV